MNILEQAKGYRFFMEILTSEPLGTRFSKLLKDRAALGPIDKENLQKFVALTMSSIGFESKQPSQYTPFMTAILNARHEQLDRIAVNLSVVRQRGEEDDSYRLRILDKPGIADIKLFDTIDTAQLDGLAWLYCTRRGEHESDDALYNRLAIQERRMLSQELQI